MSLNRYVGDYRLHEEFGKGGRIRYTYEYIGKKYYFTHPAAETARARRSLIVFCVLAFAVYTAAMVPASDVMHCLYVSLPFAFCAVPLFVILTTALSVPKDTSAFMERRVAEKIANRIPQYGIFLVVLSAGAAVGAAAALISMAAKGAGTKELFKTGNVVFGVMALCLTAVSLRIFALRKVFPVCAGEDGEG